MSDLLDFSNVIMPLLAVIICWIYLFRRLKRAMTLPPLVDVGLIFVTFVSLYAAVPLINALFVGDNLNRLTDNRLRAYLPSSSEVGIFSWNSVVFLVGFVLVYGRVWRQEMKLLLNPEDGLQFVSGNVTLVVILGIYFTALAIVSGVVTSTSYDDSYLDNFERYANLPLFLQQITGRLNSMFFVAKIALVVLIVRNLRDPWWQFVGLAWLIYEVARPFLELGSRSSSAFLLLTALLCYHSMVKPIALRAIITLSVFLFSAYMIQGVLRSGADTSEAGFLTAALSMNEFQSVFATQYDLSMQYSESNQNVPWQVFVADFLRLFPQQIVPFEKVDPAEWYLDLIGYKGTGVGFSFGVISEGLLGFGLVDIFFRGAILGGVLGLIHNVACKHSRSFGWIVFYLWFCTRIYLSYRNSLFFWLSSFFYEFLPGIAMLYILRSGTRRRSSNSIGDQLG